MKNIQLKKQKEKVVVNGAETDANVSTIELLKAVINSPSQGGYTASDMLLRIKLLDKIDKNLNDPEISFEDSEFEKLSILVREMRWNIISKTILEFIQLFETKN